VTFAASFRNVRSRSICRNSRLGLAVPGSRASFWERVRLFFRGKLWMNPLFEKPG